MEENQYNTYNKHKFNDLINDEYNLDQIAK